MNDAEDVKNYSKLIYEVRRKLDVTMVEYAYLDMVYQLSRGRWCNKTLEHIGEDIGLTKMGVDKLKRRMIIKGFIEKNEIGNVRTTEAYNSVIPKQDESKKSYNPVQKPYNSGIRGVSLSTTKTNKRLTKTNIENFGKNIMPDLTGDFYDKFDMRKRKQNV